MKNPLLLKKAKFSLMLVAVALGSAACSLPNKPVTQAAAVASKPITDGEILQIMSTVNEGEIKQARIAMERSTNPAVREAAQRIITDHTAMDKQIASLSTSTGIKPDDSPLNSGLRMQANSIAENLTKLSGTKLDCTYFEKQAEQHALTVKTVRGQLMPAANRPEVRSFLTASLPALEHHQQTAQAARSALPAC
ncbi:MAG TPA: DUF4142 domain-containing protein [Noviherbaspirillum sp.]|uniref:DUF4142 domain-containing protein n=1 Tax=Noviherbaspirillum sp. TaxID=1926288 RepID=UPI002DDD4CE1|nr:DUF4142 domain-containing protein [Noviherbaspirillum sp.]HEV2611692.1 DUF4142 domain-containing protein [Noviherbaspirillum sp.]